MDRFSAGGFGLTLSPVSSGDCAAAAARAAAADLIFKIGYENITVNHSHGASRTYMVQRVDERCNADQSEYTVQMEQGAAPDIRERANIHVNVSKIKDIRTASDKAHIDLRYGNLFLKGGEGIGTATANRPGIRTGDALIEKDARAMIFDAVADVCEASDGA